MIKIIRKARAVLQIIRPELPAAAGICVVVGQAIGLGSFPPLPLAAAGFCLGFCRASSAMVFNDYFDLEVDRINSPQRPLPAGLLTGREAVGLGCAAALIALAIALALHPAIFGLSLALWIAGFLYNWRLKSAGLWGNLIVSANVAMTILIGGFSVGRPGSRMVWLFTAVAFLFDLAEEIAGDAMDMAGDQKRGSRSIALVHGRRAALRVSGALFGAVLLLTLLPAAWGEASPGYWLPIALMDVLIVFFSIRLLKSRTPASGRGAMRGLYICATLALAAFVLGSYV